MLCLDGEGDGGKAKMAIESFKKLRDDQREENAEDGEGADGRPKAASLTEWYTPRGTRRVRFLQFGLKASMAQISRPLWSWVF